MKRSPEMVLVGYFLARCGNREGADRPLPPKVLRTEEWNTAYACFYSSLGDGRPLSVFENSLKNARDLFDGHLDSGRVGWRDTGPGRAPLPLTSVASRVFSEWQPKSADALWSAVKVYCDEAVPEVPRSVLKDLEGELDNGAKEIRCRSEGGVKYVLSPRRARDPTVRADAFRIHGYRCQICTFDFGEVYGKWGEEFAEVHHRVPLGGNASSERTTNPETDLVVLCANCHRMAHRKEGILLTVEELRRKINVEGVRSWSKRLADAPSKAAEEPQ
jgi:5-methylcytosine-specific restriction endonuclease McrA